MVVTLLQDYLDAMRAHDLSPAVRDSGCRNDPDRDEKFSQLGAIAEQAITDIDRYFADYPVEKKIKMLREISRHANDTADAIKDMAV